MKGKTLSREKLVKFLERNGIEAEIIDTGVETPTVVTSSEVLGLSRKKIVKTIVFRSEVGVIVAIMRGDQRVSERRLAELIDAESVELADPKTVKEATGYNVGGVPPVGHDNPEDIIYVMDPKLLECDRVYGGGGDNRSQLSIRVKDILKLVRPKISDIAGP